MSTMGSSLPRTLPSVYPHLNTTRVELTPGHPSLQSSSSSAALSSPPPEKLPRPCPRFFSQNKAKMQKVTNWKPRHTPVKVNTPGGSRRTPSPPSPPHTVPKPAPPPPRNSTPLGSKSAPRKRSGKCAPLPLNPRKFNVADKEGNLLNPDDPGYRERFCAVGKHKPATLASMQREWNAFKQFLAITAKERYGPGKVEDMLAGKLNNEELALMLSDYLESRINKHAWAESETVQGLDTTTLAKVYSQLASMVKMELKVNMAGNHEFDIVKETKNTLIRDAQGQGMGQLSGQKPPLPLEVLEYLFQCGVLNTFQPYPLIISFYVLFTIVFCTRVRQEMLDLTVGDIVFKYDQEGQVVSMGYSPRHALKKNVGVIPTSNRASHLHKRAHVLPSQRMEVCLIRITQEVLRHLAMLPPPPSGDRLDQHVFMSVKTGVRNPTECFFSNVRMGRDTFDNLLKYGIVLCGVDLEGLPLSNQSLRVTSFNLQDQLGFTEDETSRVAGHSSTKTQRIYKRGVSFENLSSL